MRVYKKTGGFTIIEILVVVAIIGILIGVVMGATSPARSKGRDSRRLSDFRAFELALNDFYSHYLQYPCGDTDNGLGDSTMSPGFLNGGWNCELDHEGLYDNDVGIHFINNPWPKDPTNKTENNAYFYWSTPNYQNYIIVTRLETRPNLMTGDGGFCDNLYEFGPGANFMDISSYGIDLNKYWGVTCN